MKHRIHLKKLSKTPAHRKAMIRNMLAAFFRHEQIKTTRAKAKVLQRFAERLITKARTDSVACRRHVRKWVQDKEILAKLFTTLAPLFAERKGGYTRIVKIGPRFGDAAEMVYFSLVEFSGDTQKDAQDSKKKDKKTDAKKQAKETKSKPEVGKDSSKTGDEEVAKEVSKKTSNEDNEDSKELQAVPAEKEKK